MANQHTTNREGLTYSEWFAAASYGVPRGNLSPPWGQLRRAWRAGVDPTEIAAAGQRGRVTEILLPEGE